MTAPVLDWSEIRLRLDTVGAGVRLAFVMGAVGGAYAAASWSEPNRPELLAIFAATIATGLVVLRAPTDAIVRSRWRELFFLAWTLATLGLVGASIAVDGGASSPLVLLLFPPLVFAALSYPLSSVVMLAGATELLYVGVATPGSTGATARVRAAARCGDRRQHAQRPAARRAHDRPRSLQAGQRHARARRRRRASVLDG
jgi:hypothetical protein